MNTKDDIEEDDYRESEDEDYKGEDSEIEVSEDELDDEDRKLEASYSKFQGSGGIIKTRARRKAEAEGKVPKPPEDSSKVVSGQTSVDVDALWKEMNGSSPAKVSSSSSPANTPSSAAHNIHDDEFITINRTYKFAGEVKSETKRVLRNSAEGQDFLREEKRKESEAQQAEKDAEGSRRLSSSDEHNDRARLLADPQRRSRGPAKRKPSLLEEYQMNKTKKINSLEKSRLDWLGFVDKEGIKDDLTRHNKGGYLDKQSFLNNVDEKIDKNIRQQRAKQA